MSHRCSAPELKALRAPRRPLPAWLAALALVWQLLAPGLCLAHSVAAGPQGPICSATPGNAPAQALPDAGAAAQLLGHCGHCLGSPAAVVGTLPQSAAPAPRAPTLAAPPAAVAISALGTWQPPPRGPPRSA